MKFHIQATVHACRRSLLVCRQWLLALAVFAPFLPAHAYACGGCFSPPSPQIDQTVVQNAERVLFLRDEKTKKSTVWVEVRYSGAAKDFGWVLPVPKVPKVGVGTVAVFDALDAQMAMRYAIQVQAPENCHSPEDGCDYSYDGVHGGGSYDDASSADASSAAADASGTDANSPPGVQILSQGATGPYDYVVVQGDNAQVLYDWLNTRGYAMPAKAKPIIQSHIEQKNVFVAVHLQNGQGIDAIRPIALEMDDAEPCVPLRLTSIAAADELSVIVTIVGQGRAVPKNHLSVEPNPLRMNFSANGYFPYYNSGIAGGQQLPCTQYSGAGPYGQSCGRPGNFDQVVSGAIDEAGSRAFVTEAAMPGQQVQLNVLPEYVMLSLGNVKNLFGVAEILRNNQGVLEVNAELADTLEPVLHLAQLFPKTPPLQTLANLRACAQFWTMPSGPQCNLPDGTTMSASGLEGIPVDGVALAKAVDTDLVQPLVEIQKNLLDATVTRLSMRISPFEMDRDPVFAFNKSLPNVNPQRAVQTNLVCRDGWYANYYYYGQPQDQIGQRFSVDGLGSWVVNPDVALPQDPRFHDAPLALQVQLLEETGLPLDIATGDVSVVSAAIVGAKPGQPSLPGSLVLKTPVPWVAPPSDPLVTKVTAWHKPQWCPKTKPCWVDGELPPWASGVQCDKADAGNSNDVASGPVPGIDASGGWVDVEDASSASVGSTGTASSGCTAARTSNSTGMLAFLCVCAGLVWRRGRRKA